MKTFIFTLLFTIIVTLSCTSYAFYTKSNILAKQNAALEKKVIDVGNTWLKIYCIEAYDNDPLRKIESKKMSPLETAAMRQAFLNWLK